MFKSYKTQINPSLFMLCKLGKCSAIVFLHWHAGHAVVLKYHVDALRQMETHTHTHTQSHTNTHTLSGRLITTVQRSRTFRAHVVSQEKTKMEDHK